MLPWGKCPGWRHDTAYQEKDVSLSCELRDRPSTLPGERLTAFGAVPVGGDVPEVCDSGPGRFVQTKGGG